MTRQNSAKGKIIGAVVLVIVVALAAWWYFSRVPGLDFSRHGPAPSTPASAGSAGAAQPIEHPISEVQTLPAAASTVALPALDASDSAVTAALTALPGAEGLAKLLLARGVIPRIVATVDALPRHTIGNNILPLRTPNGDFATDTADGSLHIDSANYARYDRYMKIVQAVDARTLVAWYVHWYPLFQQAYQKLGYPNRYFNDRVMQAIDNLLAAPNAHPPVTLVDTGGRHYAFADPTWEALSVGQKLMIRIGPEHERALKSKLRTIRTLLLGKARVQHPPAGAQPATSASAAAPAVASSTAISR